MLHFRMIVPIELAARVDAVLAEHGDDISNIIRFPGVASHPDGDLLLCDVARGTASDVLAELHAVGLDRRGSIAVESVDLALSRTETRSATGAFGGDDDAVVWQEVEARAGDEVRLSATFLVFMAVATMIAAVGVVTDQPILIVGAMVVGPDFGPLAAMAVGIVRRRWLVVGRSAVAIVIGYVSAILVTVAFSLLMMAVGWFPPDALDAEHPNTGFIWQPNVLSYVVGLLAGIAGVLSLTSAKSGALVGVLISVTTVPAAGAAAVAFASGEWATAGTSLVQLGVNLVAIVTGGAVTLAVQIAIVRRNDRRRRAARRTAA
ncbi:DUF389 domain-containing protein [Agromyces sp. NPDC058136]|uniref:DUF389 domain-containing protein n=1 Tax=Agromyces sp. NPDC058136 TaxID=3346354 RepID=UPI0036DEC282